jgi:DeoR/GlpR family transcriptional regulator of sugar metabolism
MMRAAEQVIVVADSTKFGHQSLARLCPIESIHTLVVDNEITEDWRGKMTAAGINLLVAGRSDNA